MAKEEKRSLERSQESDLDLFKEKCSDLKILMSKIRSSDTGSLTELKTKVVLTFLDLKQLNRYDKYRGKSLKDTVNRSRAKVDEFHLRLQNLLYEVIFLEKEIKRSLDYTSRADEVNLIDLETFFKESPLESTNFEGDEHNLMLRRLEWELNQRIQLAEQMQESSLFKTKNLEEVKKMMELLSRLRSCMTTVVESLKPLEVDSSEIKEETPAVTPRDEEAMDTDDVNQ